MTPVQAVRVAAHELEAVCKALCSRHRVLIDLPDDMQDLIDKLRDVPGANRAPPYADRGDNV